jgi:transposase
VIPLFVIPQAVVAVFQVRFSSGEEQTPTFHFLFNFQVFFKDKKSKCEREKYKKERKIIIMARSKILLGDNKKFTIYFT